MRAVKVLVFLLVAVTVAWPQAATSGATPDVAEQVKQLREMLQAQQTQIQQQHEQIQQQHEQIQQLQQQLTSSSKSAQLENAAYHPPEPAQLTETGPPKSSPLSFRIGAADFTPGGFVDFDTVWRSTNTQAALGTNYNAIPFSNTPQGHLSEIRPTAQHSRVNLRIDTQWGINQIRGYIEADFNGNDAANVFVSANGHTNRLRHFWVDVRHNKWEFFGGQAYSWLTPNRNGVSPMPADVFIGLGTDPNNHAGLTWTRAAQLRVVYHPSDHWAMGVALENPQQYIPGQVSLPAVYNSILGVQVDGGVVAGVPNLHPDIIPKLAYDNSFGDHAFHFEVAGLLSSLKIAIPQPGAPSFGPFQTHSATGGGIESAVNFAFTKDLRLVATGFWSDGGGRYIFGLAPDAAVMPIQVTPTTFSADLDLIESFSGMGGFEWQATPHNVLYSYYGGVYVDRDFFPDVTAVTPVKPLIGYGGPTSSSTNNRSIQQVTLGWNHTLWSDPHYGSLLFMTHYSYLTRSPWAFPATAPKNAHLSMMYVDLRYVLP